MDEQYNEEELRLIIDDDELFDEYNLTDMYTVCDPAPLKSCTECRVILSKDNAHHKNTFCYDCNNVRRKEYYSLNKERCNEHSRTHRLRQKNLEFNYMNNLC